MGSAFPSARDRGEADLFTGTHSASIRLNKSTWEEGNIKMLVSSNNDRVREGGEKKN